MELKSGNSKLIYAIKHVAAFFLLYLICFFGRRREGANSASAFGLVVTGFVSLWVGLVRNEGSLERLAIQEGLRPGEYTRLVLLPLVALIVGFWTAMLVLP